jgi:hypothetical protein
VYITKGEHRLIDVYREAISIICALFKTGNIVKFMDAAAVVCCVLDLYLDDYIIHTKSPYKFLKMSITNKIGKRDHISLPKTHTSNNIIHDGY